MRRLLLLLRGNAGASVLDSLVTSGTMFCVQLSLIGFAAKADYGAYSLLMSYVLMGQAILSAVFGAPLITAASRLPQERRSALLGAAVQWQLLALLLFAGVMSSLATLIDLPFGYLLVIATVWAFAGLSIREIQRVCWTAELQFHKAVANGFAFAMAVLLLLTLIGLWQGQLTAFTAMTVLGFSALAAGIRPLLSRLKTVDGKEAFRKEVLVHSRWTIPGVIVIWVQNNLYLTLVAAILTLAAVAEVSAARLIAMPYLVAAAGLLRLNQAQLGRLIETGTATNASGFVRRRVALHLLIGITASMMLWAAGHVGPQALVPPQYPNLLPLAALWFLFAGVIAARGVVSCLFQAEGRYKSIFLANLTAIPLLLIGLGLLIPRLGVMGAVIPLIAAEFQLLVVLIWLERRGRHSHRSAATE